MLGKVLLCGGEETEVVTGCLSKSQFVYATAADGWERQQYNNVTQGL